MAWSEPSGSRYPQRWGLYWCDHHADCGTSAGRRSALRSRPNLILQPFSAHPTARHCAIADRHSRPNRRSPHARRSRPPRRPPRGRALPNRIAVGCWEDGRDGDCLLTVTAKHKSRSRTRVPIECSKAEAWARRDQLWEADGSWDRLQSARTRWPFRSLRIYRPHAH